MNKGPVYYLAMEKTAFLGGSALQSIGAFAQKAVAEPKFGDALKGVSMLVGATALGANVLQTIFRKIDNDTRCKALIEDLATNDPVLKEVDRDQLKEWYATMYYYAPTMSTDKATVKEILQGFARFGKIDIKTLQLLTDTEDKLSKMKGTGVLGSLLPKLSI